MKTAVKILILMASLLLAASCNKSVKYTARYTFNVSDELNTKAVLEEMEGDVISISWEKGDAIDFKFDVYDNNSKEVLPLEGGEVPVPVLTVQGKVVYEGEDWTIYEKKGNDYTKTDAVVVSIDNKDSYLTTRYSFVSNTLVSTWYKKIPFVEGEQTLQVEVAIPE